MAAADSKFRLLTYNILTDHCIRPGQYTYCPPDLRYMDSRHVTIMAEVKAMNPDVICFQEVDVFHYESRLRDSMSQLGYDGVHLDRQDDQGLATFWKQTVFRLERREQSTIQQLAEQHIQWTALTDTECCVVRAAIQHPEAVLFVHLTHLSTNKQLAVANIHVTWSRLRYPALQATQMCLGLHGLCQFVRHLPDCSLIYSGDFNSPPTSLPYHIMSRGSLDDVTMTSLLEDSTKYIDEVEMYRAVGLLHVLPRSVFCLPVQLLSAYHTLLGREPPVTNCDDEGGLRADGQRQVHQLCLDYIWTSGLQVDCVLETPSTDVITEHYALPSTLFPSDHIPLLAQFSFTHYQPSTVFQTAQDVLLR